MNKSEGLLIVMSGPSGTGKGTVCQELLRQMPDLRYSVSMTTRAPRPGEEEGVHYYFCSRQGFEEMIAGEDLLEWAEFCNDYYGTPKFAVEKAIREGLDVVLEIDTQGAQQIKKRFPQGIFTFLAPPSLEELSERIRKRGTESEEAIKNRLAVAVRELEYIGEYDYTVVNDEVPAAVEKLKSILIAEKCRVKRNPIVL